MNHMTIEELKDEIYEAIKQVNASDEPIFIGENDKEPEAVLVSLNKFEDMLEAIRIFSDKELYRKAIDIINDNSDEVISWEDALKELGFSDDTLDEALENSDIEAVLKDVEEGKIETFDSVEDLIKDLNDEDENIFKKAYRENIDLRIEDVFCKFEIHSIAAKSTQYCHPIFSF